MQPLISALPIYIIKSQYRYHSILWITYDIRVHSIPYWEVLFIIPFNTESQCLGLPPSPSPITTSLSNPHVFAQTKLFSCQHPLLHTLWKQHIPFVVNYALFSTSPDDLQPASQPASHIHALMNWPITRSNLKSKTVNKRGTKLEPFN